MKKQNSQLPGWLNKEAKEDTYLGIYLKKWISYFTFKFQIYDSEPQIKKIDIKDLDITLQKKDFTEK